MQQMVMTYSKLLLETCSDMTYWTFKLVISLLLQVNSFKKHCFTVFINWPSISTTTGQKNLRPKK